ncbi:glycoside hydrolase family 31 protein [Alkalibacterium pelagium]|uniref:Alpha-D-xyloside xylohydrolase n=1 Tax=Alkalibacterium pelagium TaxID=426702 RepID=A0A1H7HAS5_9LACT|nr:TIM-barrel domain-containing protein [Alkalibacterium pelagium]GEN51570.1 glycosyl hydrolase [Alkalibacterium pelagium]SEK47349.1 alpha-D-xyloside xylohydrolase [Alkalibacterium pelagium]
MFKKENNKLYWFYDKEKLLIEPWGKNSFRIRAGYTEFSNEESALLNILEEDTDIQINKEEAFIVNGKINVTVNLSGHITIRNHKGEILLKESEYTYQLKYGGRQIIPNVGSSDYTISMRLETQPNEKIFGMGQYQHDFFNLKGCMVELTHRNSQISIPFFLSNLGYGMLWNNPSIGKASFNLNVTEFTAECSNQIDYWITAGDTPAQIEESYAEVTGKVPMMPEYAMGLWQSKLRYQNQEELLGIARKYKDEQVPLSVIVIDFFHWPNQGDWCFDETYWPDPLAMITELENMGIETMISVWPTVESTSLNYHEMVEKGFLVKTDRGVRTQFQFLGQTEIFDATNADARKYLWEKIKANYYDYGIKTFWLDEAEPEFSVYDHDIYRFESGPSKKTGNMYPLCYSKTFYDGMRKEGQTNIINLVRAAWAGSQRYGALVWSGDIPSTFQSLNHQVKAGLSMGIAGIPWWTTDIGGFHGGNIHDSEFKELMIRWFQYATFCPVLRMHGDRLPSKPPIGESGGGLCHSGAENEIWSYGEEAYNIFKYYISLRESLKLYIKEIMLKAHNKGTPPMRPLFYEFPDDPDAWEVDNQFMFGSSLLIAPVLEYKARKRNIYLPKGTKWEDFWTKQQYIGGQSIEIDAPIDKLPIMINLNSELTLNHLRSNDR